MRDIFREIKSLIEGHDVVLFMKGAPEMPMCGFSGVVVSILNALGVKFHSVNILEDQEMREGIKKFADWLTIPQLYVKGEFVGGCDIVKEMYQSGELLTLLKENSITVSSIR
ncbi:monothiol glutaredoxin, Grx4 family [Neorickettsia helminthoeca str. Oregon]|uniref:Glutaredoxin n=1 Tax=Neorickettsia helminthoeca str. Oregon TaxID=1286528 RepID=X5HLA1_9RICK|nr:Grx4 family monothiol glutaredoxin [Neorickettsia helminthoeca]AHX11150.1 monothiol glutaredoxin, Grx4 family [Neorickettsia helminthoeca str. Oregon]